MKIIILGPPGSGKGTVSQKLEEEFGWFHLSAGELLREEVEKKTSIGKKIAQYVNKGKLVPNKFVVEMVKLEVSEKDNYILDGFPRSLDQAKQIKDLVIDMVLYLKIAEDEVVKRLSGRRTCATGEHVYHIKYIKPKKAGVCDVDGTKLVQREDDKPSVIRERFRVYDQRTQPVVEFYRKKGVVKTVDASLSPKEVYELVRKEVRQYEKNRKK